MNPNVRFALVTLALGLTIACMVFAESGYSGVVVTPQFEISEIPLQVGGWQGRVKEIEDDVFRVLGADAEISAEYEKIGEPNVFVHFALWTKSSVITKSCPHHPNSCYGGQGWRRVKSEWITIDTATEQVPVQLTLFERGFEAIVVAHNYRMGQQVFTTMGEGDEVIRELWGAPEWPAVVKYMVQIPVTNLDAAAPIVEEISPALLDWSSR
jgi:EpsI family protein